MDDAYDDDDDDEYTRTSHIFMVITSLAKIEFPRVEDDGGIAGNDDDDDNNDNGNACVCLDIA